MSRTIPIPANATLSGLRKAIVEVDRALAVKASVNVAALNIDWNVGDIFYKDISAASTFTFSNVEDGRTIIVIIKNTSGGNVTVAFPTTTDVPTFYLTVAAGTTNIYTFIRANSITYASCVDGMT